MYPSWVGYSRDTIFSTSYTVPSLSDNKGQYEKSIRDKSVCLYCSTSRRDIIVCHGSSVKMRFLILVLIVAVLTYVNVYVVLCFILCTQYHSIPSVLSSLL